MALKIKVSFQGSCPKHRRYNPAASGEGGIKGGCPTCYGLLQIWQAYMDFREAKNSFGD